jgi:hypothetical protein
MTTKVIAMYRTPSDAATVDLFIAETATIR